MIHKLYMSRVVETVGESVKTFVGGFGCGIAKKDTPGGFWVKFGW